MRKLALFGLALALSACTSSPSTVLDVSLAVPNPQFGDHDPVEWDSYRPEQYPVHGIDVSHYQSYINWDKISNPNSEQPWSANLFVPPSGKT